MTKQISVQNVLDAIDGVARATGKATTVFREYIGFPSAKSETMETKYTMVLDACKGDDVDSKRRNGALRVLMCECRKTCAKPYAKDKKGNIIARTDKPTVKGATHKISDVEPVKTVEVVREVPVPLGELEVMDKFAEMANAYLTADDVTIVSRIIAAMRFNWGKAAKSAKKTRK